MCSVTFVLNYKQVYNTTDMQDDALIVVFPSEFSRFRINQLIQNIKKILEIKDQKFQYVKRDNDVIIVHANDPVFASSAINQLFGIKKIAIAKRTQNDLNSIVTEITKLGGNLLLRGEKFIVQVRGAAKGFVPKDAEMAATSAIIEQKTELGATPGTENKHDKLLYTYITKKSAYVSIFLDQGHQGVPNLSQNQKIICPIFDEISAVSCIEMIKRGFEVKILVIYRKKSKLNKIAKILSKVMTYTLQQNINLEFFNIDYKQRVDNQYDFLNLVAQICKIAARKNKIRRIAMPISNQIFPIEFVDDISRFIYKADLILHLPVQGLEDSIKSMAKEFVLDKYFNDQIKIYKNSKLVYTKQSYQSDAITIWDNNRQNIQIQIGPNNVHDILDGIK